MTDCRRVKLKPCLMLDDAEGLTIHQHRLCNIIRIMSRHDMIHIEGRCSSVQRLSPEHATESAIVLFSYCRDDSIHCPPVELVIGEDLERHVILLLIAFNCL